MAQYPQEFIDRLHLVWGPGFLSPGGPAEVGRIVDGLDLNGKTILDFGCGAAGPAIVLARDFGAHVVGVDVEPTLLDNARRNVEQAGVSDHVTFRLVQPGRLPFEDNHFDVVFSKEAMLHIPDKAALFVDVNRILKPGGVFAASDWLKGEIAEADEGYRRYMADGHLQFDMATAMETEAAMVRAGFADVRSVDRHEWYGPLAMQELADIQGPLREKLIAASDLATYEKWVSSRMGSAPAFLSGGLRPTHLRGRKPR